MSPESPTDLQPSTAEIAPAESPSFGWNGYAERINGRFAMVGFLALLALEFVTKQDVWTWLGLR